MVKRDSCGCAVERKYASDFLTRRFYVLEGGGGYKKIGRVELGDGRWFELYTKDGEIRYKASECPLVIIGLEVLLEAREEGNLTQENWKEVLSKVKGLQVNSVLEKVGRELTGMIYFEESSVHS
ncbi:hypothetical protein DFR87_04270 [Metallosphaera hakonensis JCM 8857 = DSM 7519]|uniref:Uncharacterized protein n=2 Tax=Metallosphaera hakonensis TaxID=79601 RepID=A0A2U9IXG5_9CREN|nr:hypothetical protein DFR87_04270 [Metallosphaera hakonensis JCM 8857 = DSM 7519]